MKAENEIWKDIPEYEGFYQVSSLGRVKSLCHTFKMKNNKTFNVKEKILQPILQKTGYYTFNLCKNTKRKCHSLHRLIATSFIENPLMYTCVNHKDEIKTNNSLDNLEWCTKSYNRKYGTCQERIIDSQRKRVVQLNSSGQIVKTWDSVNEAGRNGFNAGKISLCCNGKRTKHKDYLWKNE